MSTILLGSIIREPAEEYRGHTGDDSFTMRAKMFPQTEEVRKTEGEYPDALLSPCMRLSLRRPSGFLGGVRRPSRFESRGQILSARASALAFNQQGALVAGKMNETDRPIEQPGRAGVTVLAEEIDERLSGAKNSTTAELREIRREFTHRLKDAAPHVVIEVAELLIDEPGTTHRFVAYELIHHHPAALSHLNAWQLEQLGRGIASWGAVDCFAVFLAGPVWRGRRVPNSLIHGWRDRPIAGGAARL